jgi:hypothetical protein
MQAKPMAQTSKLLFSSLRVFIFGSFQCEAAYTDVTDAI